VSLHAEPCMSEQPFCTVSVLEPMDLGGPPRNHALDGCPDPHTGRGNSEDKRAGPGLAGGRYTQNDSAGGSTATVQMPLGVYSR